jgi:hypothetical protein
MSVSATLLEPPVPDSSYSDGMPNFIADNLFLRTPFHQTSFAGAHIRADPVDGVTQLTIIRSLATPLRKTYPFPLPKVPMPLIPPATTPLMQWHQARWKTASKRIVVTHVIVKNHRESTRAAHSRCKSPPIDKYNRKQGSILAQ